MPVPLLAIRGKGENSLIVSECHPKVEFREDFLPTRNLRDIPNRTCRVMQFSNDGALFVYCNSEDTLAVDSNSLKIVKRLQISKACGIHFSPDDEIVSILEPYFASKEFPNGKKNLKIFEVESWSCIAEMKQKSQSQWHPQWCGDSDIFARLMTNNLFFYKGKDFENVVAKLHIEKLESFCVTPKSSSVKKVAVFIRGAKGGPSSVRIFEFPNFSPDQVLANKSFFKADTVTMLWNANGSALLIRAAMEVDTSGASYYGEQSLHFMNVNGDTSIVQLPKNGPIYDVAWDPRSTRFCVTYGFMPAKASIFNLKCNIVHDFDASPKNLCVYNPHGNILLLAGFGNLRGNVEIWRNDDHGIKQVGHVEAPDTTQLEWCPDGEHFVTATTTPRLRVNNGYKIWHYSKTEPISVQRWPSELHQVSWQPFLPGIFPKPEISNFVSATSKAVVAPKPQSYVPPHARGRSDYSAAKFKQEDESPKEENLSKAALKNKKKREAAKKKKESEESHLSSSQKDAVAMAKYLLSDNQSSPSPNTAANSDTEKKLKNLRKKLQNIEKLKQQQKCGKQLEKNQIEKLAIEPDIVSQIRSLEIGLPT